MLLKKSKVSQSLDFYLIPLFSYINSFFFFLYMTPKVHSLNFIVLKEGLLIHSLEHLKTKVNATGLRIKFRFEKYED